MSGRLRGTNGKGTVRKTNGDDAVDAVREEVSKGLVGGQLAVV